MSSGNQSATYWTVVAGNFVALGVFVAFVMVALVIAWWLGKRGAPGWLIFVELVAVSLSSAPVTIRIHEHFAKASCRHSDDYNRCMDAAREAELPEWEPPTE